MKTTTLLSATTMALALTAFSGAVFASEQKPLKKVTEIVGYNVTETVEYGGAKRESFNKIDVNNDNAITSKEFMSRTNLENGYDIFLRMDTNKDKVVSLQEFGSFNKTKGNTRIPTEMGKKSVKGTNLKSKVITTNTYFEPVEPKIVDVKTIEPASGE